MGEMDFHSMKRKQLQALCKEHKIRANLTNVEMANKLTDLFKEKEKSCTGVPIMVRDEVASETESSNGVVNKKVKKVRFSPEHELIEFARSHKSKRSRRSTILCRASSLSVENVDSAELYSENVKNAIKRWRKRVIVDDKTDKQASVNVDTEKLVHKIVEVPSRVTRSRVQKLGAASALVEKSRKKVVKSDDNVQALVIPGNNVNGEVNRRSLRNKGIVNEENLAICMKLNNTGKGKEEVLDVNKSAEEKVMCETQILVTRSKRKINTVDYSKMVGEGLQVNAEVTRGKGEADGKLETMLQNQQTVKAELRRSRRKSVFPSHEQLGNFEPEPRNEEVPKPGGLVKRSRRNKLDPKPVSSMPETTEQIVKPCVMDKEASFVQKNTRKTKRNASKSLEVLDEFSGDDIIQHKNETKKKKKVRMSEEVVVINDSSHNTLSIMKESEKEKVEPAIIDVSDEKVSSILEESNFLEGSLQESVPELRESLSAQMSVPKVAGNLKHEDLSRNISPTNSIALTDTDEKESGLKDLQCEKKFSDMVVENANLSIETDVQVLVEESICVADNNDIAVQMTGHTEIPTFHANCEEVTENSNVCENVHSAKTNLLADTFTFGDQTDFKTHLEVTEAEAEECIEHCSDLVVPVEPVCIDDVILPIECDLINDVDRLKESNVSSEVSNEDIAEKDGEEAGASKNSEGQVDSANLSALELNDPSPAKLMGVMGGGYRAESDETVPCTVLQTDLVETDENSLVNLFSCERSDTKVEEHETPVHKDVSSEWAKSDEGGCLKDHRGTSEEEDGELTLDDKGNAIDQYYNKDSDEHAIFHGFPIVPPTTMSANSAEVMSNADEKDDVAEDSGEKKNNISGDNMSMDKTIIDEEHEATTQAEESSNNDTNDPEQPKGLPVEAIATENTIQAEESMYRGSEIVGNSTTIFSTDNSKTEFTSPARNSNTETENGLQISVATLDDNGNPSREKEDSVDARTANVEVSMDNAIGQLEITSSSEGKFQYIMETEVQFQALLACNMKTDVNGELSEGESGTNGQEDNTTPKGPNEDCHEGNELSNLKTSVAKSIISRDICSSVENKELDKDGENESECGKSINESSFAERKENELRLLFATPMKFDASYMVDEASCPESILKSTSRKEGFRTMKDNMVIETKSDDKADGGRGMESEKVINECLVFEATDLEVFDTGCIAGKDENDLQLLFATPNKIEASCEFNEICGCESKLQEYSMEKVASHEKVGVAESELMNNSSLGKSVTPNNKELNKDGEKETECEKSVNESSFAEREENELQLLFATPMKFDASGSGSVLKSTSCKEDNCTVKENVVIETKSNEKTDEGTIREYEKVTNESLVFAATGHEVFGTDSIAGKENNLQLLCGSESKSEESCLEKVCSVKQKAFYEKVEEATDHEVFNTGCIQGEDENDLQLLFSIPHKIEASCEVNETCGSESKLAESCVEKVAPNDESMTNEELDLVNGLEVENQNSRTVSPFANAFEASKKNRTGETCEQEQGTSSLSEENIFSLGQTFLDNEARDNNQEFAEIITTMSSPVKNLDEICHEKLLGSELSEKLKMGQSSEIGSCLANGDAIEKCNIHKETLIDVFVELTSLEIAKDETVHGEIDVVTDKETGTTFSDAEPGLFSDLEMHLFLGDNNLESSDKKDGKDVEEGSTSKLVKQQVSATELHFQDKIDSSDEILKESDVMETIQEYMDSESSKSIDIDHSAATLPCKAPVEESKRSSSVDEDSILDEVSALRRVSTAKKTARTILIHGTPSKALVMADMKENEPFKKNSQIGDITTTRPAKRRALQDI